MPVLEKDLVMSDGRRCSLHIVVGDAEEVLADLMGQHQGFEQLASLAEAGQRNAHLDLLVCCMARTNCPVAERQVCRLLLLARLASLQAVGCDLEEGIQDAMMMVVEVVAK
jgi:hypothetical protein